MLIWYWDFASQLMSTFHMEYERIWKRKISFVSVCFVIARYWTVIGLTVQVRASDISIRLIIDACAFVAFLDVLAER
jgi:hypothetical protein